MKRIIPISFLAAACAVTASVAAIPSLINYQGRLTDSSGNPMVGSKTFAVSIYDASTAGNLLFTESVGSVVLDNKGIYSFQFGSAGTSNTETSESVATTDGALTTFQKVLANAPIVAGSLSITDGTYTWDQTSGSSNESEFSVFYVGATGQVTVIYSNVPAEGVDITATYRHGVAGITGALSGGGEHWLEVSVDGVAQATRDRVLTVPFAMNANHANTSDVASAVTSFDESLLAVSTTKLFDVLEEVALANSAISKSYVCEVLYSELGERRLVVYSGNLFNYMNRSMTTRSETYSHSGYHTWEEIAVVNRYTSGIMLQASGSPTKTVSVVFEYKDGTDSLRIEPTIFNEDALILNPSPQKIVNQIVVRGDNNITTSATFTVVRDISEMYLDINVGVLSDTVHSLKAIADGLVSDGGILKDCLEWRIRYTDDSMSSSAAIGETIAVDTDKTVSTVRLSAVTANLGAKDLDISKVLVWKISE